MPDNKEDSASLIVLQSAPYEGSIARSSLDLALSFAVFSQAPRLLFCGDAVLCLQQEQRAETLGRKSLRKVVDSLPLYDIERVFVDDASLQLHGLTGDDFPNFAVCVNTQQVQTLIREARHVISL